MSSRQSNTPNKQKHSQIDHNTLPLRVYLLTVWREANQEVSQEVATWRFRLEDPQTRQQRGFVDARELMALLEEGLPEQDAKLNVDLDQTSTGRSEQ